MSLEHEAEIIEYRNEVAVSDMSIKQQLTKYLKIILVKSMIIVRLTCPPTDLLVPTLFLILF